MGQFVETEVHCSTGRADCIVHTKDIIYIFELKLAGRGNATSALKQIKDKNYAGSYNSYNKKIIAIGSSFDEKKRTIKEWKIEKLV